MLMHMRTWGSSSNTVQWLGGTRNRTAAVSSACAWCDVQHHLPKTSMIDFPCQLKVLMKVGGGARPVS